MNTIKTWATLLSCALVLLLPVSSHADDDDKASKRFQPRVLKDTNPQKDVVEVVLTAREGNVSYINGVSTKVYTYNGIVPGPMIKAKVGDTLIVHFYNQLPEETTVHWHGLELPANMDGSSIAQNPVQPGGYFRYEFKLLRAATYWYHPHIRGNEQVELGLHGTLVVRDKKQDKALGIPKKSTVLVLDDVLLDDNFNVADPLPTDPLARAEMIVNGREGNTLLVNGKVNPIKNVRNGKPQRLRIVNTSNSRFMRVSIPGHQLHRIGGDGGLLETPITLDPIGQVMMGGGHGGGMMMTISDPDITKGLILTPGERADVIFTPKGKKGDELALEWHDIARGRHTASYRADGTIALGHYHMDGMQAPVTMMRFKLKGKGKHKRKNFSLPSSLRDITTIDATGAGKIPVMFGHGQPDAQGNVTFFAAMKDGKPLPFPKVTAADAVTVAPNETRVIEVVNMTGGIHNYHLHGFMFQHIETQYVDMDNPANNYTVPATHLEDKDTILVPGRPGAMMRSRTIVRLAVKFDDTGREGQIAASGKTPTDTESGGWLMHCHILEHADSGMTSFVQVQ